MRKKLWCSLTAILISLIAFSQNYVYKGNKQLAATQNWNFQLASSNLMDNTLLVCVAKNKTGGYLMLSIEVPFEESISGNIFIILENGKTITLTSRVVKDHVDNKSQVLYTIIQAQLLQLAGSSIAKIRFSLKNPPKTFGGMAGNYTATNEFTDGISTNTWDTAKDISELN